MDWFTRTIKDIVEFERIEQEKPFRLSLQSVEDIPEDIEDIGVFSLHISSMYEGMPVIELLRKLLSILPELKKLSVYQEISWHEACSLELDKLEELTLTIAGDIDNEILKADGLKSLTIFADVNNSAHEMGFPELKELESLHLFRVRGVNPSDFSRFSKLKILEIKKLGIVNLDWLQNAEYQLDTLIIDDNISDCSGLTHQKHLQSLSLWGGVFLDVSPIANMSSLKYLDMYGALVDQEQLREAGIEQVIITDKDRWESSVNYEVRELCREAAKLMIARKKELKDLDELSAGKKRYVIKQLSKPLKEQVKEALATVYLTKVAKMKEECRQIKNEGIKNTRLMDFQKRVREVLPFIEETGKRLYGEKWEG